MYRSLSLLLLAISLHGCAVFPQGGTPPTTLAPSSLAADAKPNLAYSSTALGGLGQANRLPPEAQSVIEGELVGVLQQSGYFGRLSKQDAEADIKLDVTMTNTGSGAAMIPAIITGLSFYTIPSWATDHFRIDANVTRRDGVSRQYQVSDSTVLVQWLPMIFVFPFSNFSEVPSTRQNMYRKLLADMQRDGMLEPTAAPAQAAR
jgi:hypothetical protein